ncbi:MAG: murein biosynthesis integral membrane protein MurJ [Thermomicrobiales bacterium]
MGGGVEEPAGRTHNRFTLPAYAPVVYNAAGVGGALFLAPRYGVKGLAWGIVLGSLLHVLLQFEELVAIGMRYSFLPKPVADGVRQVGRLLVPRIVGQAAFQINFTLVLTTLASRLGESPASALNYGYQLMMLPHGLLAISVSTVIFPLMARQYAQRQFESLKATFGDALRPLFFLTIPASAALAILARPIVQSIYQRGSFSAESTLLVADVLPYFAAGLVALALVETSARAFYAMHDTRTPLVASLATIAVNLVLAVILLHRLGGRGLAAAMTVTTTLEVIVLLGALRRKIGPFDVAVWTAFIKSLLATIAMALVLLLIRPRLIAVTDPDGPATIRHRPTGDLRLRPLHRPLHLPRRRLVPPHPRTSPNWSNASADASPPHPPTLNGRGEGEGGRVWGDRHPTPFSFLPSPFSPSRFIPVTAGAAAPSPAASAAANPGTRSVAALCTPPAARDNGAATPQPWARSAAPRSPAPHSPRAASGAPITTTLAHARVPDQRRLDLVREDLVPADIDRQRPPPTRK